MPSNHVFCPQVKPLGHSQGPEGAGCALDGGGPLPRALQHGAHSCYSHDKIPWVWEGLLISNTRREMRDSSASNQPGFTKAQATALSGISWWPWGPHGVTPRTPVWSLQLSRVLLHVSAPLLLCVLLSEKSFLPFLTWLLNPTHSPRPSPEPPLRGRLAWALGTSQAPILCELTSNVHTSTPAPEITSLHGPWVLYPSIVVSRASPGLAQRRGYMKLFVILL